MENKNNNAVTITGVLKNILEFSYEAYSEKFYKGILQIRRSSGVYDEIRIIVSERLSEMHNCKAGDTVKIEGELRSYNKKQDDGAHLILAVFAKQISHCEPGAEHINNVALDGFVCKEPIYRITPLGREITDLHIAVNGGYHKSAYIPAIAWGRNAAFAKLLKVGDKVEVYGRIQSREYVKRMPNGETVTKTAYEVSVNEFNKIEEDAEDE